ncbi:MAG: hypothetical protein DWI57_13840 [Chloroflexi bacterium]|nr:MAG: hypothetical protein DWI57_13840 [Chloroflexota bacterium]
MATAYAIEQRVSRLDEAMAEMAREVALTSQAAREASQAARQAARTAEQTSREMAEFKREMADFKIEMRKAWGELSNRLGTMAEDLVAPSVPRILRTVLGCPGDAIEQTAVRMRRRSSVDPAISREFDVIASCGDYFLINETKSRLSPQDVTDFGEALASVRQFFPEVADKRIVGAIASLYVDESLVRFGERNGLIVLGFGQDVMDVLNSPGFSPRFF